MITSAPAEARGRVPPHNLEAEESLLGSMLLSREAIAAALELGISAGDFYKPAHGHIFDAITATFRLGDPVDPVTVAESLRRLGLLDVCGGGGALVSLQANTPAIGSARRYAEIVQEHALARGLVVAGSEVTKLGFGCVDGQGRARDVHDAITRAEQAVGALAATVSRRSLQAVPGGAFILDAPPAVPVVWGRDQVVIWASGEPLLIAGPPGVGKTTLGQQVTRARLGIAPLDVLGMPVAVDDRRLLYIAADRPSQAQRSFARMVGESDRAVLDERLIVWRGPLPDDLGIRPESLVEVAKSFSAGTVVVDSLKDVAVGLAKDEVGAAVNRALQLVVAAGVEVLVLHHQRKDAGRRLEDVFGSAWITAGCGSVLLVSGDAGDLVVEVSHLKQPAEVFGPVKILHDHERGLSRVVEALDPLEIVRAAPRGVTAHDVAVILSDDPKPERNDVEKARRRLEALAKAGHVHKIEGQRGGAEGGTATRYFAVAWRSENAGEGGRGAITQPITGDHAGVNGQTDHEWIMPITPRGERAGESG